MPTVGGPSRPLTDHPATDWFAVWSPDDQEIAFISDRAGSNDIWVVSSDGGEPRRITTHPAKEEFPEWSRDGAYIIFESSRTEPPRLFRIPLAGGEPEQVTEGAAWVSSWSPDGETLFFHGTADRRGSIWVKSLSTGREFAVAELSGRRGDVIRSTLATDGSHLYFVWGEYESDIWVMDVVQ